MSKSCILTLSKNGSLGSGENSTLDWTVKEDKKWFAEVTKAIGTVVMGRKTFETIGSKPLKDRVNYIITRTPEKIEKTEAVIPLTLEAFHELNLKDYCVVGGYEIYRQFMSKLEVLYISHHKNVEVDGPTFEIDMSRCVLFDRSESDDLIKEIWLQHPSRSQVLEFEYTDEGFINQAKELNLAKSVPGSHITASVLVKNNEIIGQGTNYDFHEKYGCERKRLGCPTGVGYELCEGCQPQNHSEPQAIKNAKENGNADKIPGSENYLYGHWWCCEACTRSMEQAGEKKVYLSREWTSSFLKIINTL